MKKTVASLVLAVVVGAGACSRSIDVKITPLLTDEEIQMACRAITGAPQDYSTKCRERLWQKYAIRHAAELHARAVCEDRSLPHECERLRAALVEP